MNKKREITTSTGEVLTIDHPGCISLIKYAKDKGLSNILVLHSEKHNTYLLLRTVNSKIIMESQILENIATHIDILSIFENCEYSHE